MISIGASSATLRRTDVGVSDSEDPEQHRRDLKPFDFDRHHLQDSRQADPMDRCVSSVTDRFVFSRFRGSGV